MKKIIIIMVIIFGINSCESKESHYKDIKIKELTIKVDSLEEVCHEQQLELWSQEELIYSQDTTITMLQNKLKK